MSQPARAAKVRAPAAPTHLTAGVTLMGVSLTWSPSSGAANYTVYRSTDGSRGSAIGTVTAPSLVDSTAAPGTKYTYGVTASNSAGESPLSAQANATIPLPAPAQTINLFTVSASTVVAGQGVVVNWATSNATAVRLNGAAVGASGSQPFTPAANATYTLQADGAVATISAGPLAVTVTQPVPSPTTDAGADFLTASTAPGVFRAFSLNNDAQLGSAWLSSNFTGGWGWSPDGTGLIQPTIDKTVGALRFDIPSLSGANGGGSWQCRFSDDDSVLFGENSEFYLRAKVRWNAAMARTFFFQDAWTQVAGAPTFVDAATFTLSGDATAVVLKNHPLRTRNAAGTYTYALVQSASFDGARTTCVVYFPAAYPLTFGSNTLDSAMTGVDMGFPQEGIKFFDVGTELPKVGVAGSAYAGQQLTGSDTHTKLVAVTQMQCLIPNLYEYGYPGGQTTGLWEGGMRPQNALPNGACSYPTYQGCELMEGDEWVTFKAHVKILSRRREAPYNGFYWDNAVEFSMQREGQPAVKLVDWNPSTPGYVPQLCGDPLDDEKIGRFTAFPYMTRKDGTQVHEPGVVWVKELILSTQRIADDVIVSSTPTPSPTPTPTPTPTGNLPAWRQGQPKDVVFDIPGTANAMGYVWPQPNPTATTGLINAWNGLAVQGTRLLSLCGSGHREWQNPVLAFELGADQPAVVVLDAGSVSDAAPNYPADQTLASATPNYVAARYGDGRPTSRHTYYSQVFVPGSLTDGVDRGLLVGSYACYGIDSGFGGGPQVESFRFDTNKWEPAGTFPDIPYWLTLPAIACDPRNGTIYYAGDYTCAKLDVKTRTWTMLQGRPGFSDTKMDPWNNQAALVDVNRNKLVGLITGYGYLGGTAATRLQRMDLTTNALDEIVITGDIPYTQESGFDHDLDGDRYLAVSGTSVYAIDADTGKSAIIATVGALAGTNSPVGRFKYVQALGGAIYAPQFSANFQFMPTR